MNCTRVNLLKKSERRYQGAVSKRFIVMTLIIAPALIGGVLGVVKTIQYRSIQSQLTMSREVWSEMEPRLELFKNEMAGLRVNQNLMGYFSVWNESTASFEKLLDDVQHTVPDEVQFMRMSIRSPMEQDVFEKPEDAGLSYKMEIHGLSQGRNSEYNVIELRKEMLQSPTVARVFDTIKLASMRKRPGADDTNLREFRLEGAQLSGGAQ